MKAKSLFAASALVALAACTSEELVNGPNNAVGVEGNNVMSFSVQNANITRANMQDLGIYSFGVWGLKSMEETDAAPQTVFDNYLVGYYNPAGNNTFYGANATTIGDEAVKQAGYAMWFYEGLGNEYNSIAKPVGDWAESNSIHEHQYLKFWDYASHHVEFFAYTPYELAKEGKVTFKDNTLTVGTIWAQFDEPGKNEYLLAYKSVPQVDYKDDVVLSFKRINAKVRLAFYEKIAGYKVQIDKVSLTNAHMENGKGVEADADVITVGGTYSIGTAGTISAGETVQAHFANLGADDTNPFHPAFGVPEQIAVAAGDDAKHPGVAYKYITDDRSVAVADGSKSMCPYVYYAMPADAAKKNSGFNVTVDFTLYSEDTNETMKVKGATVYVDDAYDQWKPNTNYLYVFRITKDALDASGNPVLKPIVFDGIQVEEYTEEGTWNNYDWVINAEDNPTAAIKCSLPSEINEGEYTEFYVTNYVQPAITDKVYAKIKVSDATMIAENGLQFNQTNPVVATGWTNFDTPTDYVYTFMKPSGFTLEDGLPLLLRIKPVDVTADTDFWAEIEIKKVSGDDLVTSCKVTTKIKNVTVAP